MFTIHLVVFNIYDNNSIKRIIYRPNNVFKIRAYLYVRTVQTYPVYTYFKMIKNLQKSFTHTLIIRFSYN